MYLVIILIALSVESKGENADSLQLINGLKEEMMELKKIRQQDSETIRKLQEEVHRVVASRGDSLSELERSVQDSSSRNADSTPSFRPFADERVDLKTEVDFLRQQLMRLNKKVEDLQTQKTEERSISSSRIAVRWLQRTVEDFRHEMKEMAKSLNISAALADKERTTTNFALLRSDVAALGHRMDSVRVDRETNSVRVQQLRQDVDELRLRLQESAVTQQRLIVEMEALKAELREHILLSKKKNHIPSSMERSNKESWSHGIGEHSRFRHNHWKVEMTNLQETVSSLEYSQTDLNNLLKAVIKTQATSMLKLSTLEKELTRRDSQDLAPSMTHQRLTVLENSVNKTEQQMLDIQSRVNNITISGIQKLHGSTMQLFNALERLESNYDRTTDDIRKEISKLDYNFSQTQSDFEELRDRHISSKQVISSVKNDVTSLQSDTKSNHLRILLLQNSVFNRTSMSGQRSALASQDGRISTLESQIQSLTDNVEEEKTEIEELHRQVVEKANDKDLIRWERAQRKVREGILQFKEDIPKIKKHQEKIEREIEELVSQLPKDCSETLKDSGTYIIRHPTSRWTAEPIRVFCDMDTAGGKWTVIQRRSKGDQDFNRNWDHYKEGFGDVSSGDFWLGNEMLHQLTTTSKYTLRIDLWDASGNYKYAEYATFQVLDEKDDFRLAIAGYHGNASDALSYHNGMAFSTPDRDNDASSATHCADFYHSGWWYNHCQYVNINGRYNTGITWYDIKGQEWSELTKVEMKIRPTNTLPP